MRSMNNYWMEDQNRKTYSFSRKPFITTSRVRSLTEDIFFDPDYKVPYTVSPVESSRMMIMMMVMMHACMLGEHCALADAAVDAAFRVPAHLQRGWRR